MEMSSNCMKGTAILFLMLLSVTLLTATGDDRVKSGEFNQSAILTGTLRANKAEHFVVPMTDSWQIQIKWMEKEGEHIKPGDPVVRFDTSNLVADIENLEISLQDKKEERLQKLKDFSHQKFEVEVRLKQADIDYKKKKIDAEIPRGLETYFEYDKKQLEVKRSAQDLKNAEMEKKVRLGTLQSEIKKIEIEIEEAQLQLDRNKDKLKELNLIAQTEGTLVYEVHPWEGRKFQIGDNVPATFTVATIPEMDSLEVEAQGNEAGIQRIKIDQAVDILLDAYPDRLFKGNVRDVSNSAEKIRLWGRAHYSAVRVSLEEPDGKIMKPGMSVKCIVRVGRYENVLLVPLEYVQFNGKLFRLKPDGKETVSIACLGFNEFYVALDPKTAGAEGIKEGTRLERMGD